MKSLKIKISVLLLMVATGVYVSSCSADEEKVIENNNLRRFGNELRVYYDRGDDDYGCEGTGGNCLPDVIITDEPIAIIRFAQIAYKVTQYSPAEVRGFFEEERDLVLEFFDEAIVDEVINGDCIVSGRGDIERTFYFIFKDNISEEILAVYPIITK